VRVVAAIFATAVAFWAEAAESVPTGLANSVSETGTNMVYPIDLPTTLRLAGAQNLDIQIAREHLSEAQANRQSALEQFLPWLAPGVTYHRRDGVAQSVPSGVISDAHFQSYYPGVSLSSQMALGDALYNSLAAKQLVRASDQALETQRQDSILSAAQGYFDLAKAKTLVEVVRQALLTSQDYQQQLHAGVAAGIAFRGDELRVQSQTEHFEITLRQALEQQRVAAANLAQLLHLDSRVELIPQETELVPITLVETNAPLDRLVEQALASRPELKQSQAFISATRAGKNGAVYGPLIPSVGAQVFGGGLGGGPDGGPSHFGAAGDYTVGLSWKIGPGGLFDSGRVNASKARLAAAQLNDSKLNDLIISQVVAGLARVQSLGAQIELAKHNLATAGETLRLTRERKQFGVGAVLEDIQAQQDLNQARSDFVTALAEYNKAQYALNKATGVVR
jgi:outer membrane protein TolC